MINPNAERVVVGQLGSSHGVRGWMKVTSYTDPAENLFTYAVWQIECQQQWVSFTVEFFRQQGKSFIVKLAGIEAPEAARVYSGKKIAVYRSQLPILSDNEFYCHDLLGLTVINTEGVVLGAITEVMPTGANDVLVVETLNSKRLLLPYIPEVILQVDLAQQRVIVAWAADF